MENRQFHFHLTMEVKKKQYRIMTTYCAMKLAKWFAAISFFILLSGTMIVGGKPLNAVHIAVWLAALVAVEMGFCKKQYRRFVKTDERFQNLEPTVTCVFKEEYMSCYSSTNLDLKDTLYYKKIRKMVCIGQNMYILAENGKRVIAYVLPEEMFMDPVDYREVKTFIRKKRKGREDRLKKVHIPLKF